MNEKRGTLEVLQSPKTHITSASISDILSNIPILKFTVKSQFIKVLKMRKCVEQNWGQCVVIFGSFGMVVDGKI